MTREDRDNIIKRTEERGGRPVRKEKSLRQRLTPFFFLAIGIPIAIFACISMYRLDRSMRSSLDRQIEANLSKGEQCLDLVLDKYDTLLYDLSTDNEMLSLIKEMNQNEAIRESTDNAVISKLRHISSRSKGIEGITIVTSENQIIYYDQREETSADSTWAAGVPVPNAESTPVYMGTKEPVSSTKAEIYMLYIVRNLYDIQEGEKVIGTIVMSISENVLTKALAAADLSVNYLLQDDVIISAPDNRDIGKTRAEIENEEYRFTEIENERSGFTVFNRQSLEPYHDTFLEQSIFWILIAAAAALVLFILIYAITSPYLKQIDMIAGAMNEVERGNFKAKVAVNEKMPVEISRIGNGFNEMVEHIETLIEQVKDAVLEQKNAELSALEAQIDPHFLYNTLDTINWKAIERGEFEISEMVGALADILRYSVKNAGEETTIGQEIYWLHQYILLQSAKIDRELKVQMDVPEEIRGCRIHKLLLQPFVENAVKHGLKYKEGEWRIDISMRRTEDQIHIIIADNGCGMDLSALMNLNINDRMDEEYAANHLGIMNVRKRLTLYYGDMADIYFESEPEKYTKVHLFIPVVHAEQGGNQV